MQSLIISWAVSARFVLLKNVTGVNVLAVGTVNLVTSTIPVPDSDQERREIMGSARCVSFSGRARRAVDMSKVKSPWRHLLSVLPVLPVCCIKKKAHLAEWM